MSSIRIENVCKEFEGSMAVKNLSLEIADGEFLVLVGPSGCGKSTLLRMLAGLEQISSGRILQDGNDISQLPPRERNFSMIFQNYALFPHMTVEQNIIFGMRMRNEPKQQYRARVDRVAELLQLGTLLNRKPGKQLVQGGDKPTAVFMHHPPLKLGSAQMDRIACENGDKLLALIDRFPALCRVFCGHTHRLIFTQYRQATITTIPGTVHQVPYFHENPAPYYNLEPAACLMHRLVEGAGLVSYLHSLAHYPGPYLYNTAISCPVDSE